MAGATSNNTREAVAKTKEMSSRSGVDYILTATPYYNKPTQEGVYQHFKAIAEASTKPLVLYNIAGRTGTNIETPTLLRLAEIPNIAGVKEASGNISQIAEVCASVPEDFLVFSGDDAITLAVIGLGGVGIVSVVSNEIPAEMTRMTRRAGQQVGHRASAFPQVSSAHAGQLHRVQSRSGEGRAGDDGPHRRGLSPAAGAR